MKRSMYPRHKVFIAFFLCPLVLGFIAGVIKFMAVIVHLTSNPRLLGEVRGGELLLMPLMAPLIAQLLFLLPFLGFSLVVSLMRVRRTSRNCVLLALIGGGLSALWALLVLVVVARGVSNLQLSDYLEILMLFFASAVTCWLAARFFLPERHGANA